MCATGRVGWISASCSEPSEPYCCERGPIEGTRNNQDSDTRPEDVPVGAAGDHLPGRTLFLCGGTGDQPVRPAAPKPASKELPAGPRPPPPRRSPPPPPLPPC